MSSTPDVEAVFRQALADRFEAAPDDVFVATEMPADLERLPKAIRVYGLAGSRLFNLTTPGISVDCYASADTPQNARLVARQLATQVDDFIIWQVQRSVRAGAKVGRIETIAGPAERPYANTNLRRFGMTYRPSLQSI